MPFLARQDLELWFEIVGNEALGPPRLFANGSGSSIDDVRPLLSRFAGDRALAVVDHRGLGRSGVPNATPHMSDFADDLLALTDHLGWATFDLIGVSFGGMVAQEVAIRSPERIRRLVLMCTSAGGDGGSSYPLHELMDLDDEERRRIMPRLQDARFDEQWLRSHDGLVERLATAPTTRTNTVGYRMQMEARRHHDVWDRLGEVSAPTLVASGVHDRIAPPENGRRIAERIPDARYRDYDGGHMFFLQDRSFFVDMEAFLSVESDTTKGER